MKKNKNRKKGKVNVKNFIPLILVILVCFGVILFSSSFGVFEYIRNGLVQNRVTTASDVLELKINDEDSLSISNENSLPVTDEVGRATDPYEFTINNTGTLTANYEVKIVDDQEAIDSDGCSSIQMPKSSLRYELIKNDVIVGTDLIGNLTDNIIDDSSIVSGGSNTYKLRIWIDSTAGAEIMGKHFHGKIEISVSE